jgi:hypothetical protein
LSSRPTASSAGSLRPWGLEPPGPGAPAWTTSAWLNAAEPLTLAALRGHVVVLHAFQMLCPACVQHGLPQAQRIERVFGDAGVVVLGLHTVFEHHEAMTPVALAAFLHEYRIGFPVGIDAPSATPGDPVPITMQTYAMRGTPTLLLFDRQGALRRHAFGVEDDMSVAAAITALLLDDGTAA